MSDQRPNVDFILCTAIEIESAERRAAYLDQACGGDTDLRAQVERLLRAHFNAGDFLGRPVAGDWPRGALNAVLDAEDGSRSEGAHGSDLPARAGRYHILGEVARGGMGVVLRAHDADFDRTLAIKVMLSSRWPARILEQRFLNEARITGRLQHPGIPPVHELGRLEDGRVFFAMKLIEGRTLEELLRESESPGQDLPRFVSIFEQICQTIAFAHSRGYIHRDLKPVNVMVGAFGEVQVMDWGLAKNLVRMTSIESGEHEEPIVTPMVTEDEFATTANCGYADTDLESAPACETRPGAILGTPAYMAPEQARGEIGQLDERADVFGLGAILCEILTGKPPYVGEGAASVLALASHAQLDGCFARLDACGADPELISLTRHCLAPARDDRPQHAGRVAEAVTEYLAGVQERLKVAELARVEAQTRSEEERRRRKLQIGLAAAVLLILTLIGGGALYVQNQAIVRARQVADAEREEARRSAQRSQQINDALLEAERYRAQSATGTPQDTMLSLAKALAAARKADAIVHGNHVPAGLQERVASLISQLRAEEKDQRLLADLNDAFLAQTSTDAETNRYSMEQAVPVFRQAFANYGMPAGQEEAGKTAAAIRRRPASVQNAIVNAMDEWLLLTKNQKGALDEPHWDWLLAVLTAVDQDDASPAAQWRNTLRTILSALDKHPDLHAVLLQLSDDPAVQLQTTRTLFRFADALNAVGEREKSLEILRRRQLADPGDFWINQSLALRLPDPQQRVRFATAAVALRPESAGAHLNLGIALTDVGQPEAALDEYREAIRIDPQYALAHANLGLILKECGQLEEALQACREGVRLQPLYAGTHLALGEVLCENGLLDEAIEAFRESIRLGPNASDAHAGLGRTLYARGAFDEAAKAFREAVRTGPPNAIVRTNLGNALMMTGKLPEAIREYRAAIGIDPQYADAHSNLGTLLAQIGELESAVNECRKAVSLRPQSADAHYGLGIALSMSDSPGEAVEAYRAAIRIDPHHAYAHSNLGVSLARIGQLEEALIACREAVRIQPQWAEGRCALGRTLSAAGAFQEALVELRHGHELGMKRANWGYPSAQWIAEAERFAALEAKLPDMIGGNLASSDMVDKAAWGELCRRKKLYVRAATFLAEAIEQSSFTGRAGEQLRYDAACAAALAAGGHGEEGAELELTQRCRWARQSVDWLRANLNDYSNLIETQQVRDIAAMARSLRQWQTDPKLAAIREPEFGCMLPNEEQQMLRSFWEAVESLRKRAEHGVEPKTESPPTTNTQPHDATP